MSTERPLNNKVEQLGKASRRAGLLSLLGAIAVIAALGYSTVHLTKLQEQASSLTAQVNALKEQKEKLTKDIADGQAQISALNTWRERLTQANDTLASKARTATPTPASRTEVQRAENAKYAVGLIAYRVPNEDYERVLHQLESDGYTIATSQSYLLAEHVSWLSRQSTVLYYDAAAANKAHDIASNLTQLTNTTFVTARGAGLGVDPGQQRWTFFIHYLPK